MEHVLWGTQAQPKRGPRPALTLEAIARAGIEAADADGLTALTMQRVAESLGVTKMALYRYVPGKAELVALMTDAAIGAPAEAPDTTTSWRGVLHDWSRQLFARFCEHPWTLESTVGARVMGPNELTWLERAVAALTGSGLDGGEMLDVAVILAGHVRNLAQQVTAMSTMDQPVEASLAAIVRGREDRFPALSAALATPAKQDDALDFGLDRILDGVETLIAQRQT